MNEKVRELLDFITEKAEAGKIEWDDDAPVFWGIVEELQAQLEGDTRKTCQKCGTDLDQRGYCLDETCPYSDYLQTENFTTG